MNIFQTVLSFLCYECCFLKKKIAKTISGKENPQNTLFESIRVNANMDFLKFFPH